MISITPGSPAFYILLVLTQGERHGYAIMKEAALVSEDRLNLGPATLYTTLRRLLEAGLISEKGQRPDNLHSRPDERRRYYTLTAVGQAAIEHELMQLERLISQFHPKASL